MPLNCSVGEDSWECKEMQPVHPKGDQFWLFIGRTDFEAETPILGYLLQRAESFEKTLMLGKIGGRRRRGRQRMRWLDGISNSMDMGLGDSWSWWRTGRPGVLQFMGSQSVGHYWATELNWTKYTLPNKRKKYLQHSGKTASIHTERVKYHLIGTQW